MTERTETTERAVCGECGGSGWNRNIRSHPVDITAPIASRRGLETLKEYIRSRLCCSECDGKGYIING